MATNDKLSPSVGNGAHEITREMVDAAVRVLWASGAMQFESPGTDHLVMERALRAALALVPHPKAGLQI